MMRLIALCLMLALWVSPSQAQTYETLQMMRPIAQGAAGTGQHANNRIYKAYQGIEYNIHADARGGKWPYTYTLSGAPDGMTIEAGPCTVIGPTCTAGTITWTPSSSGTTAPITVTVHDANGNTVSGTWSIAVSMTIGADGFCFVDSTNSASGRNGAKLTPYNSLLEAYNSCGARSIMYLRAGTYYPTTDLAGVCSGATEYGCSASWAEGSRPVIWIGYPGETAVIDFGSTGANVAAVISTSGRGTWIDNLEIQNIGNIGFLFNVRFSYGAVVRRITAHDLMDGNESNNSAFFMWTSAAYPDQSYWDTVQNSTFSGVYGDGGGATDNGSMVKTYGTIGAVIETSSWNGMAFTEAVIAVKSSSTKITIRANTCGITTAVQTCLGGNMAPDNNLEPLSATSVEAYHNLFKATGTASNDGTITLIEAHIDATGNYSLYRNTLIGQLLFKYYAAMAGAGTFTFYDNVIVNGGGTGGSCPLRAVCVQAEPTIDYSLWVDNGDNLTGANDGTIVSATTGALINRAYVGTYGHELALSRTTTTPSGGRWAGTARVQ